LHCIATYNENLVRLQLTDSPLPYPFLMDRVLNCAHVDSIHDYIGIAATNRAS